MNRVSDEQKRVIWYNHLNTRFEIVKACRFKEMQIIGEGISIRWLNCQHVGIWDMIRKYLNVEKRAASVYRSLDSYKMIPMMTFNLRKRQVESDAWALERSKEVIGPDFGLDIDCKESNWKDAIPDAEYVRSVFDSFGVRYAHWMSGVHGFHFVVPFEDFPDDVKALSYDEITVFYTAFAGLLWKKAHNIDLSIYMATRVLKCPYTIEKHGVVIFPLDQEAWNDLKGGSLLLDPLEILKKYKLGHRGIFLQGTPDGIKRMIKEWEG